MEEEELNVDTNNKAKSYDSKFESGPQKLVEFNKWFKQNNDTVTQNFDVSANLDKLQGWENPLTFQGGNNVSDPNDPFKEVRAINQSAWSKAGKIAPRVSAKILSEIAKMPGYIGGLVGGTYGEISDAITDKNEYSFTEQAFNNGWIRSVEQLNQDINKELLPVYVRKSVEEGNLWDNISSVDFWATEGADGIGFMASMMVPGAVLKSLNLGAKMARGSELLAATVSKGTQFEKLMNGARKASQLGLNAKNFDVFNATVANTYLESAAEAGMAMDSFEKEHKQSFMEEAIATGKTPEQAEQEFNTQKALLGRNLFVSNVALLTVPNGLQSAMMFGKSASRFMTSYTTKDALKQAGKRVVKNFLSEGFVEEAGQTTVENYFKKKAEKNNLKGDGFLSFEDFDATGLKQAYLDTIASTDGQKAIFLGGVLGSSMNIYQGRREDIQNKKASDQVRSLTERYDKTLQALLDTKDNVSYNFNNNRKINTKKVIEKFRTIDALSNRFAEYDEALQSGNEEALEKVRNKTIQDVILPFVKQGELGIEGLSKYYDDMLNTEDVKNSEDFDVIKARKEEVLNTAKEVSKKYDFYTDFINKRFNIPIKAANKEQQKILNAAKAEYFDKLASSYALAEMDREQVNKKIQDLNKELKQLDGLYGLNEVTTDELIYEYKHNSDTEESFIEDKKEKFAETNPEYKEILDYKKRLEEKLKKTTKEISEGFFNSKKVQDDFMGKEEDNVQTVEVEDNPVLENEITADEFIESAKIEDTDFEEKTPEVKSEKIVTEKNESITQPISKPKKVKKVEDPRIKELNKKIFLLENLNKKVIINGFNGTLVKINDERYEVHNDNNIFEININDIISYKSDELDSKYIIENLTENSVTVNNIDYIINVDKNGNIVSLSPKNKPSQQIKNKTLIVAVEIKRNQLEYQQIENVEEILEKLENNYANLNKILETIWDTNMTETVAEGLDNLYENKKLTPSQELQVSVWLLDAFKRIVRLYNEKNTSEETETLNEAYHNLEIIESLLYNLKINKNDKTRKSNSKNEVAVSTKENKTKTSKVKEENPELIKLKQEKEALVSQIKQENTIYNKPEVTEEEQLDNELNAVEVDDLIKEIQGTINTSIDKEGNPTVTQEEIIEFIDEQDLPESQKDAVVLLNEQQLNSLPTQQQVEEKAEVKRIEIESVSESDLKQAEKSGELLNENLQEQSFQDDNVEELNTKGHKLMSLNKFFKPIFDVLKQFVTYEKTPRNKIEDNVSFSLGDFVEGTDNTVKQIWQKVKNGEKINNSEKQLLEKFLPIKVTLSNGKESGFTFLQTSKNQDQSYQDIFNRESLPLRRSIINSLIEHKGDFNKFKGKVQGQGKGKLNLSNNTNNNVLKLSVFNGMTKEQKIKYIQDNSYYVSHENQLKSLKTGEVSLEDFSNTIKTFYSGDVYLVVKRPNGENVPIKLNNKRIQKDKAVATVKALALLSKIQKGLETNDVMTTTKFVEFITPILGQNTVDLLQQEINLLPKTEKSEVSVKLMNIVSNIVNFQNNDPVTKMYLGNNGDLILGTLLQKVNEDLQEEGSITFDKNLSSIGFTGFNNNNIISLLNENLDENEQARLEHLAKFITYKKTNIKANFENKNYVEYVFDLNNNSDESGNALVSTNVEINKDMFEGYSNIFLENSVVNIEEPIKLDEENKFLDKSTVQEKVYPEPELTNTLENNSENIRNSQENSVSLQEDKIVEVLDNGFNSDNLTIEQKKAFNKLAIEMLGKEAIQTLTKLKDKSIDNVFNTFKNKLIEKGYDYNETLKTVCKT